MADTLHRTGRNPSPTDLVATAARLHGVLALPWDDALARLAEALPADVVLSAQLDDATTWSSSHRSARRPLRPLPAAARPRAAGGE